MEKIIKLAKDEAAKLEKDIAALEADLAEKNEQLGKLQDLIGSQTTKKRRGRPPKKAGAKKPGPKPGSKRTTRKKPGPKPGSKKTKTTKKTGRRGRPRKGENTLPALIVDVLKKADKPLNAQEVLEKLQKESKWKTASDDPKNLVYKTLHRIEKNDTIKKVGRGTYTL